VWRSLLSVFGLHTYLPFLITNVAVHLAVVHLIWRLACRARAGVWAATAIAALFMVSSSNGYNAFWAFQISFNGTVALGLAMLLVAERPGPMSTRRLAALAALGLVTITFSSIAIPVIAGVALLMVVRHGWLRAGLAVGPAALAFATWYLMIGRDPVPGAAGDGLSVQLSSALVEPSTKFFVVGVANAIGRPFEVSPNLVLGAIVLVVLGWCVVHWRDLLGRVAGPAAAAAAAAGFVAIAAVGRSTSAADDPTQARYLYVAGALLLPLVIVVADSLARPLVARWRPAGALLLAGMAVLIGINTVQLRDLAEEQAHVEQVLRGRVLEGATMIRAGVPHLADSAAEPQLSFDVNMAELAALVDSGWVPEQQPLGDSEASIVRISTQLGLGAEPVFDTTGSVAVASAAGVAVTPDGTGCIRVARETAEGAIALRVDEPTSLELRSDTAATVVASLRTPEDGWLPAQRSLVVPAGSSWLDVATTENLLALRPPAGGIVLCGVT
jgi:hypothetical protein